LAVPKQSRQPPRRPRRLASGHRLGAHDRAEEKRRDQQAHEPDGQRQLREHVAAKVHTVGQTHYLTVARAGSL